MPKLNRDTSREIIEYYEQKIKKVEKQEKRNYRHIQFSPRHTLVSFISTLKMFNKISYRKLLYSNLSMIQRYAI